MFVGIFYLLFSIQLILCISQNFQNLFDDDMQVTFGGKDLERSSSKLGCFDDSGLH